MTLHIVTGASAAGQLDLTLSASEDILLLENARIWNQHESNALDPVEHTLSLKRPVLSGRPNARREFQVPRKLTEVSAVRRGDPIRIWSTRNLDDALLSLWLFNCLDGMGYASDAISFISVFVGTDGDPISSVEQLPESEIARFSKMHRPMNAAELSFLRDRWALLTAPDPTTFERLFVFDFSVLKGWQDIFLTFLQRVPSIWGHAQEATILLECLRATGWDEGKAFVQYVTQLPFSPSKLREPDARALLRVVRAEAEKAGFRLDTLEDVTRILRPDSQDTSRFCVPFFWRDTLRSVCPPGTGLRVIG